MYCGTISLYVRLYARTYRICAYGPNIRLSCARAHFSKFHVPIILKVVSMANRQQDRNEELAEESTVEDTIAARVRGRRTEARRQRERAPHRQRRVAGQIAFTKFSFRGGGRL